MPEVSPLLSVVHESRRLRIRFFSDMAAIDRVEAETRTFLTRQGLSHEAFSVCLVMREGLINAVRHGNGDDPKKRVNYVLGFEDGLLTMEIEDEGDGFDWRTAVDRPPSMEAEHGRGIIIMQRYASECRYNEKGNRVTLTKRCVAGTPPDIPGRAGDAATSSF
ncbi:MAG: ATP-binding protein [Thermodesulfobacteriota bacterium]